MGLINFFLVALSMIALETRAADGKSADGKVEAQTQAKPVVPDSIYGSLEIRHHNNYFFDANGRNERQTPSSHVRLQLGYLAYQDRVDIYSTIGAYKLPKTLEVKQKKPEVGVDITLLKHSPFQIVQYTLFKVSGNDFDDGDTIPFVTRLPEFGIHEGSELTIGLMPSVIHRYPTSQGIVRFKFSTDVSSFLYSEDSWVNIEDQSVSLVAKADDRSQIRDSVPRYHSVNQLSGGIKFSNPLEIDLAAYYDSLFAPQYFWNEDHLAYHYVVDRVSRYRLRLKYELSDQISIINDFSTYYRDFFGSQLREEEPTYKNLLRLSILL